MANEFDICLKQNTHSLDPPDEDNYKKKFFCRKQLVVMKIRIISLIRRYLNGINKFFRNNHGKGIKILLGPSSCFMACYLRLSIPQDVK